MEHRLCKLRDAAIGQDETITHSSPLSLAHFECLMDVLTSLYNECTGSSSLSKDRNVSKFINKFEKTIGEVQKLRVNINDFEKKCTIGRGHYGEVQVVKEKSSGKTFAMKIMRKADILKNPDIVSVLEERDIMAWTHSPWLTSMKYSFQDTQHLYIVMDFFPGGDLFGIIEKEEGLDEAGVKFYLAEIASGLNDLHQLGFVHRDVKPENVLIARSGHVRLVDFGVAARVENGKVVSSQLPVGTPSYLAPEVLRSLESSDGYGVECDWWSLGIIAYELMVGVTPFEGDTQKETYDNIMNYEESLQFPDEEGFELSAEFQDLIRKLCTTSASRLGFEQIKKHNFFTGIDWDHLLDATPPYIPSLSGPDDTSHFEQIKPQPGMSHSSLYKSSRTQYGFNGQSLHFVGFTHSKFPATTPDHPLPVTTVSQVDTASEDIRVKLSKSEEERRKLETECAIYQSQLEDLNRQLEMEKLDRRSTDAKTLQLLNEVKQQGQLVQEMKDTETRNTVDSLQKVVEQMEQDQAMLGKKVHRLQESIKSYKKEAEQSKEKSSELEKKLSKLKGTHQKELSSLQAKLLKVTKDGQGTISELRNKLTEAEDELVEAKFSVKQLKAENTSLSRRFVDSKDLSGDANVSQTAHRDSSQVAMEGIKLAEMELRLESQKDDLEAAQEELTTAQQEARNLKKQLHDMDEQVHLLTDEKQKLETEQWKNQRKVKNLIEQLEEAGKKAEAASSECKDERAKREQISKELQKSAKALKNLQHSHVLLQKKVTEFEDCMSQSSSQRELVRAVQNRNVSLEDECKKFSAKVAELNSQLEAKDKEMIELREYVWKEKAVLIKDKDTLQNKVKELEQRLKQTSSDLTQSRSKALELRKSNRDLEKQAESTKDELTKKTKRLSSLNQNLEALSQAKTELLSIMEKRKELETNNKALKEEVQELKNKVENDREEYSKLYNVCEELRNQLETENMTSTVLQQKVDSLELDLEAMKSAESMHKEEEKSWKKTRQMLENDVESAETLLDKTKIQLEAEQKSRQQAEAKLTRLMSRHETTESVSQQELMEWKDKYEQSKEKAKEYSELLSEVKQRDAVLEVELREIAHQLTIERQLSSKLHDQYYDEHRQHNILKAAHMRLVEKTKQAGIEQELLVKQHEEQLDQLREHATEQTKMQVTISQQSKLIDYLQDKTPTTKSTSRLRKGLKKMIKIKRSRDPAREMEDWNKFKGFLAKKSSSNTANSPVGSTSFCFGKSPSLSSVASGGHHVTTAAGGTWEHLTSSPSTDSFRSTRSATAARGGTTPLREVTLKQCQVNLPRSSSTLLLQTSPTDNDSELMVTSPKRKNPSSLATIKTIEHNIPHKFSSATSTWVQAVNCAACKNVIKRGHKIVKCKYCKATCHPSCAADLPNTCGLPAELAEQMFEQPPSSKKARIDSEVDSGQLRKEGWLQVYHAGKSTYNGSQEWVVISDDNICCYSRMDISRESTKKNAKAILPLHNPSIVTVLHPTLKSDTTAPVSTTNINQAFAIEQFREDGDIVTYFVADNPSSKKEWIKALEGVLQDKSAKKNSKNLKEASAVPKDASTPMLLRSRSASSSKSQETSY